MKNQRALCHETNPACQRPRIRELFFYGCRNPQQFVVKDDQSKPSHTTTSRKNNNTSIFQKIGLRREQSEMTLGGPRFDVDDVVLLRQGPPRRMPELQLPQQEPRMPSRCFEKTRFEKIQSPSKRFFQASSNLFSKKRRSKSARASTSSNNKVAPAPVTEEKVIPDRSETKSTTCSLSPSLFAFSLSSSSLNLPSRSTKQHSSLLLKPPARKENQNGSEGNPPSLHDASSRPSSSSSLSSLTFPPRSKKHSSLFLKSPERTESKHNSKGKNASSLHDTWYYSSNHVLVNRERTERGIPPLMRSTCLDEVAKTIAQLAAFTNTCISVPKPYHGNVICGMSIRLVHFVTMETFDCVERENLLNPDFEEFGMATHKGRDGRLYICQLFDKRRCEI